MKKAACSWMSDILLCTDIQQIPSLDDRKCEKNATENTQPGIPFLLRTFQLKILTRYSTHDRQNPHWSLALAEPMMFAALRQRSSPFPVVDKHPVGHQPRAIPR